MLCGTTPDSTSPDTTAQHASTDLCGLLASLLAKLALQPVPSAADILLQQLLPQLLDCTAMLDNTDTSSATSWVSTLCDAAAQLLASAHAAAAQLAVVAVNRLEQLLLAAAQPGTGAATAAAGLPMCTFACIQLLAAMLTTEAAPAAGAAAASATNLRGIQEHLLQQLLAAVIPALSTAGGAAGDKVHLPRFAPKFESTHAMHASCLPAVVLLH